MTKPFLTYELQLDKLSTKKKLIINDREKAKQVLKNIGFFRSLVATKHRSLIQ